MAEIKGQVYRIRDHKGLCWLFEATSQFDIAAGYPLRQVQMFCAKKELSGVIISSVTHIAREGTATPRIQLRDKEYRKILQTLRAKQDQICVQVHTWDNCDFKIVMPAGTTMSEDDVLQALWKYVFNASDMRICSTDQLFWDNPTIVEIDTDEIAPFELFVPDSVPDLVTFLYRHINGGYTHIIKG